MGKRHDRPSRWDLNRIIRELRADNAALEEKIDLLIEELAKRDKIIATLRRVKDV
jgi:hypothetical protein